MKTLVCSLACFSLFFLSAWAGDADLEPTVEWNSYHGSAKPRRVVITREDVADNGYVLGYVRDLIGRSGICYRGEPAQVRDQLLGAGIAWDQAETCDDMRIETGGLITIGPCTMGDPSSYSLTLGECR